MSRLSQASLALALLASLLLAGCLPSAPKDSLADAVAEWVGQQTFSPWSNYYEAAGHGMPRHPDGFTLGNREIFAAIGTDPRDLSGISLLCGQGQARARLNRATPASLSFVSDGKARPLRDFPSQRAWRPIHTGILVSQAEDHGLAITVVDFAPLDPDLDALVRLVMVANGTQAALHNAAVQLDLRGRSQAHAVRRTLVSLDSGRLLVYGRTALSVTPAGADPGVSLRRQRVSVIQPLGPIAPGERRLGIFVIAPLESPDQEPAFSRILQLRLSDPMACLRQTAEAWNAWYDAAPLHCSDGRLSGLLDGLLELMRSHVGAEAIPSGSLRYPHNRVYLRDSYWVQRAFLEAGRPQEALQNLNFLWRMWQKNGLASYYTLPDRAGHGYGYMRVELPHYLVLMVRDAERWAGLDPKPYWPMVKACLEQAAADKGYQVMNGDETWLLAVPADELAYQLDNTWLLEASAAYAAGLARRLGDGASAERFGKMASNAQSAALAFSGAHACQRGGNYWDGLPISGVIARGVMLKPDLGTGWWQLHGADHVDLGNPGDQARWEMSRLLLPGCWRALHFDEGIRSSPRSTVFDGGTPGYVLYAASHLRLPFAGDLVRGIENLSAPMGNVWELHDSQDPQWGGEKRRLWDSAVVLAGLVHYLYGITPTPDGAVVNPNPPARGWVECGRFPVGGHRLGMRATFNSLKLIWDGQTILDTPQPVGAVIRGGKVVATFPRAAAGAPPAHPTGWPAGIDAFLGSATPRFIILHENAPNHARRLAVEILRQKQFVPPIAPLDRAQLAAGVYANAIIIAKNIPATGGGPYVVARQGRATQVWVKDTGDVWADTEPLVEDLLRFSLPQRPQPLPFPDADLDLGQRLGAQPTDGVRVQMTASLPMVLGCGAHRVEAATRLDHTCVFRDMQVQSEGLTPPFALAGAVVRGGLSDLLVMAESPAPASVTVTITLPVTYWVVSSRGNPDWDRVADPVLECHDPDGSKRLVFTLHPGRGAARRAVTLVVARLPVRTQ